MKCYDDGEEAKVWCERTRRARKTHQCYECGRAIPAGALYVDISGIGCEGDPFGYRTHAECEELRAFIRDVFCGGHGYIPMGGLDEEIDEVDGHGDYIEFSAWDDAGLEQPNPLREVFDFIKASYPKYQREARP